MRTRRRDEAGRQPGSGEAAQHTTDNAKSAGGRPENQGNLPQRNQHQRPPRWDDPAGADAADDLAAALARWPK